MFGAKLQIRNHQSLCPEQIEEVSIFHMASDFLQDNLSI